MHSFEIMVKLASNASPRPSDRKKQPHLTDNRLSQKRPSMTLSTSPAALALPVSDIFQLSPKPEMVWTYTKPNITRMADAQTIWNRANVQFVTDAVRPYRIAQVADTTVSFLSFRPHPDPAARISSEHLHAGEKVLLKF